MRRQPDPYRGPTTLGIDVSSWQGHILWDTLIKVDRNNVSFAICRTGDGITPDKNFIRNWTESKKVGLIRGSYHYFRADRDGKAQADLILKLLKDAGGLTVEDLPPAIDIEAGAATNLPGGVVSGTDKLSADVVVEESLEFLETLEKALGVTPIVYTGQAFHWWLSQARPELAVKFTKYPLWVPSYTSIPIIPADTEGNLFPWPQWHIWQFTKSGTVPGIRGSVDLNKFRGTLEEFQAFVASLHLKAETNLVVDPKDLIRDEMKKLIERLAFLQMQLDTSA